MRGERSWRSPVPQGLLSLYPVGAAENEGGGIFLEKSILREIIEISATKYHILKLKSTKFDFGWDSASDPAGGAYSAPPAP